MTEFETFQQKYGSEAVFWFIYDGLFHGKKKITLPRIEFDKYQAENLAKVESKRELKQETAKKAIKTMPNLSNNVLSGTIHHLDNKTPKSGTFDGLNLISLVMFGVVNNKRRLKKRLKEQLKVYSLVMLELENTIFSKRKVKDQIKTIGKRITLINRYL